MRRVVALLLAAAACGVAAAPAAATNECRGLQVCVPVVGPWVLSTGPDRVQYQLACPNRFVVAGLDAELSNRSLDVGFVGGLGSPVNPGITTSRSAIFLGRLVRGRDPAASFRPHIGCVPASGGGRRTPTAVHAFPPGKPSTVRAVQVRVRGAGVRRVTARCETGESLTSASYALGFYSQVPPTASLARAVHVTQRVARGRALLTIRAARSAAAAGAVVQLDLVCVRR